MNKIAHLESDLLEIMRKGCQPIFNRPNAHLIPMKHQLTTILSNEQNYNDVQLTVVDLLAIEQKINEVREHSNNGIGNLNSKMKKLRDFILTISNNIEDKMNSYFDNVVSNAFAPKDITEK